MDLKLDPYQDTGADWLAQDDGDVLYLADQMRVGKTPQCAAAAGRISARTVLVICPAIVRAGWLSEFRNFCADPGMAENAVVIYGSADTSRLDYATTRLIICSYDLVIREDVWSALAAFGAVNGFDVLILDEAHYLKDNLAKRTKAVLGKSCTGEGGLAEYAERTWWVSGTPMRRDQSDLFPFMRQSGLWPKSRTEFVNQFCFGYHDGYEFKVTGSKNVPHLKRLIAPVTLRRLRSDISTAEIRIGSVVIEGRNIDPTQPTLRELAKLEPGYSAVLQRAIAQGALDKLDVKHVATARRLIGMAKVAGVAELVDEALSADDYKKVVVFGIHRAPLRYLKASIKPEYNPMLIYGGLPPRKRDTLLQSFNSSHKRRVVLANITAAGLGIDLSAADELYIFEPSWTPIDNAQAISRIINVRAPRAKEAWFVGLAGSIDDAVTRICERRTREFEQLYSAV